MTSQTPSRPTETTPNPTQLLAMQVQLLQAISESQQRIEKGLKSIEQQQLDLAEAGVEVTNFNMPFIALVGMLIKLAIAAIPASIIIGALGALVVLGLSVLGIALRPR